jgi:superfamily I DNA and/or RNA helicase
MFSSAHASLAVSLLQVQNRMHPCLSEFPSNTFYEGTLQNGVTEAERTNPAVAFPWSDTSRCLIFYQQRGTPPSHEWKSCMAFLLHFNSCHNTGGRVVSYSFP